MQSVSTYIPQLTDIEKAAANLRSVVKLTPLEKSIRYSKAFNAEVYLKREDLQRVRSYKIRGAYNKMSSLDTYAQENGIVCASAGNHAQGVALSCKLLGINGTIFMPTPTPRQKIEQVEMFGDGYVTVKIHGDSFDDAFNAALEESEQLNRSFIHPFNDEKVIEGQATVGLELIQQSEEHIDYVVVPIGGGGLASGLSSVFKELSPDTKIIGVEPAGAPAMKTSIEKDRLIRLNHIDTFVDGAAVRQVGEKAFEICKRNLTQILSIPEGKVCQTILDLYNRDAVVVEPAGALSLAALDYLSEDIKGKRVVCIVSGSNNDITRMSEIKERALLFSNLKHYFIVRFPQRAGALKEFVAEILGPEDDITHFEYTKRTNRETGSAVVGIELKKPEDLEPLITKMKLNNFFGDYLNDKPDLFRFLV